MDLIDKLESLIRSLDDGSRRALRKDFAITKRRRKMLEILRRKFLSAHLEYMSSLNSYNDSISNLLNTSYELRKKVEEDMYTQIALSSVIKNEDIN